ncbi:similar to 50S ribosomal protein L4 [Plenodomus lingam JN3]|uniref:Large ribosomal subunit protein uL4m n=1 Tax=Leptosphaeria maculans (strain JN3 / isolate v23.1.3 / race Av1-4-5-6-7-8) TaxID=985895 RepID=E5A4M6_LEPMJ|nr:similar to 50S ribosomal protein L4 [Plenodomus lingam JN3]CBX98574.1 similar to 50S ribosomal protein L4 [Plenodomus lingam JN3]
MASTRISTPMRGATCTLGRLSTRNGHWDTFRHLPLRPSALTALTTLQNYPPGTSPTRSITTSISSRASVSDITTSVDDYVPIKPFEQQTVLATIHRFPSLEPLRFQQYPANHLYLPTRRDILHRAIVYEGDNTRLGTASTKTRYEIRGSRKKVRPQKGTGKARLGDKKSPMLRGGGVAFGPRPRDFGTDLPKKVYDRAWRTALSYRYRKGELIIVDNAMEIESPSSRLLEDIFKHQQKQLGKGRSLLVTLEQRPLLEQALADMDREEQALTWEEVDVKDLLELSRVMIEREALHNILLSHQEDITHKALQPWHKSLVRASPPKELESIIGWQEFRDLALSDPAEKDVARATVYEDVATNRYTHAQSLLHGPNRNELMISSYNLLAEAKEFHFARATGLSFKDYLQIRAEKGPSKIPSIFPRIQALDYQITVKTENATTLAETSKLKSEEVTVAVRELAVEKREVLYEAALLAAQIHEHVAEAQGLQGEALAAKRSLARASDERTRVQHCETRLLEAKLHLAKQKLVVAEQKRFGERKARDEVQQCTELLAARHAARKASKGQVERLGDAQEAESGVATAEKEGLQEDSVVDMKHPEKPVVEINQPEVKSQERI